MVIDLETLDRKAAADDELNRVTAIFMGLFHVRRNRGVVFLLLESFLVSMFLWWFQEAWASVWATIGCSLIAV